MLLLILCIDNNNLVDRAILTPKHHEILVTEVDYNVFIKSLWRDFSKMWHILHQDINFFLISYKHNNFDLNYFKVFLRNWIFFHALKVWRCPNAFHNPRLKSEVIYVKNLAILTNFSNISKLQWKISKNNVFNDNFFLNTLKHKNHLFNCP